MAAHTALLGGETQLVTESRPSNTLVLPRPVWMLVALAAACASVALVLLGDLPPPVAPSAQQVLATSSALSVVQDVWFKGFETGKVDLEESACVEFFKDYIAEDVVVDYSGGPCDFLTGIHKGIPAMCTFFKGMNERTRLIKVPEVAMFPGGNLVLVKVHAEYITIPGGKQAACDEIAAMTVTDGKVTHVELFVGHPKKFVCE